LHRPLRFASLLASPAPSVVAMESNASHLRPNQPGAALVVLACVLTASQPVRSAPVAPAAATTIGDRVKTALDYGDLQTASRLLNDEIRRGPVDQELLSLRADFLARTGQLSGALRQLKVLRDRNPLDPKLRFKQAQYTSWQGRLASASSAYSALANDAPDNVAARAGQGNVHYWLGQWGESIAAFSQALALGENAEARLGWLRVLAAAGHPSQAARHALAMDKQGGRRDAELGLFIASLYAAADADEQVASYASRPTNDADLRRRQVTHFAQRALARGQKQQAADMVRQWAGERLHDYNSLVDAGDVLTAAGLLNEARPYYERAAAITPERPEAGLGLARLATRGGRVADGLKAYEEVVSHNPEAIEGWLGIARTAQMRGDKNRAWAALDQAWRVAPRSAMVFDAMCKLAFETDNRERMQPVAQGFLVDQPYDTRGEIWLQRWNSTHNHPADVQRLNALLDPLAPENTRTAMEIIRQQTKESPQQVMERVPPGFGGVQLAARQATARQSRLFEGRTTRAGVSFGHEYSALNDTTAAGAKRPGWHETYVGGFWGRPGGATYSMDLRHYERFGDPAWQINPGYAWEFGGGWVGRVSGGIAFQGDVIPRWRAGLGVDYYAPKYTASLDVNYLNFADARVVQAVPGVSWQWSDHWSSSARVYVSRNQLRGQGTDFTVAGAAGVAWEFVPLSSLRFIYSIGGENAAAPLKALLSEGLFQSAALELKWGLTEHWAVHPLYRFESHQNFDSHTVGLSVHWRY